MGVTIDETRHHDLAACIDDLAAGAIDLLGNVSGIANRDDAIARDQDAPIDDTSNPIGRVRLYRQYLGGMLDEQAPGDSPAHLIPFASRYRTDIRRT